MELGLQFKAEGAPADVEIKVPASPDDSCRLRLLTLVCLQPQGVVEKLIVNEGNDPLTITRSFPDIAAVGTSMLSNSAKRITMKLRSRVSSVSTDAAYQLSSVTSLEALLSPLIAHLFQQYSSCIVLCNCMSCRALSLLTPSHPERRKDDHLPTVYSCLLCASCDVREVSFKKFVALCANGGITIPSSIPLAPPPWEAITEGFYIEEPSPADSGTGASTCEYIMVSCNCIREVTAPSAEPDTNDEVHSDEWNDVVAHAVTMTMR